MDLFEYNKPGITKLEKVMFAILAGIGEGVDIKFNAIDNFHHFSPKGILLTRLFCIVPYAVSRILDNVTTSAFIRSELYSGYRTRDNVHLDERNLFHRETLRLWYGGEKGKAIVSNMRQEAGLATLALLFPGYALGFAGLSLFASVNNIGITAYHITHRRQYSRFNLW